MSIGNGPAGNRAADVLRKTEKEARITIISDESFDFYDRKYIPQFISGERSEDEICRRAANGAARTMLGRILSYARDPPAGGLARHPWVASNVFSRRREAEPAAGAREHRDNAGGTPRPRDSLDLGTLQGKLDNARRTLTLFEQMGETQGVSHIRGEIAEIEAAIVAKSHSPLQGTGSLDARDEPAQVDTEKLSLLMTITGCSVDQARTCLGATQGDVEAAANMLV